MATDCTRPIDADRIDHSIKTSHWRSGIIQSCLLLSPESSLSKLERDRSEARRKLGSCSGFLLHFLSLSGPCDERRSLAAAKCRHRECSCLFGRQKSLVPIVSL
ncbi:hypothetical protein Mapa_004746 [Marchantia paleacea]|nr:hypothetical protein Mapa_004746 [Marchantia paleacea]